VYTLARIIFHALYMYIHEHLRTKVREWYITRMNATQSYLNTRLLHYH